MSPDLKDEQGITSVGRAGNGNSFMDSKWLKDIRDMQSDFGTEEPEGLWEGIESALGTSRKKRPVLLWSAIATAAAAAALTLFLVLPDRRPSAPDGNMVAESGREFDVVPSDSDVPSGDLLAYVPEEHAADGEKAAPELAMTSDGVRHEPAGVPDREECAADVAAEPAAPDVKNAEAEPAAPDGKSTVAEPDEIAGRGGQRPWQSADFQEEKTSGSRDGRGFRLGVSVSNIAGSKSSSGEYAALYGSDVTRQLHSFSEYEASFPDSRGYASVMQNNVGNEVSSTVRNYQPIQAGVTLAYYFTDRFSIETGVTYSCLISDLSSGTDAGKYEIRQTLHYVGVPLNIRYDFLKIRGFRVYASAGGQVEKCVAGRTRTDYFVVERKISSENGRISVEPLQWSVNACAGVQYDFIPWAGIYLEPGAAYYFGNGSPVNCIYSERPFNFSIRAGLRFNL